ncbi:hypothetical protein [Spiroplasma floricola]|uniref:Uncharacterized protein n=1 Tax=Spiroplasma floricola 23-6 TaxID=1336749 RepID=A0A2K8SEI3_9MOLU|nr:hypothetical protein [Spiroplasma floricola]AUB31765.1 hypothetical protein SFLOR_v1c07170 [Spiroplasma floricola 23-6]
MDWGLAFCFLITNYHFEAHDLENRKIDRKAFIDFFSYNIAKVIIIILSSYLIYYFLISSKEKDAKFWWIIFSVVLGLATISLSTNCAILANNLCNVLKREDIVKPKALYIFISLMPLINYIFLFIFYKIFKNLLIKRDYRFIYLSRNHQFI